MGRILIVDDQRPLAELFSALLEMSGHAVVGMASDGFEAVAAYGALKPAPDAVLLDHRMPGMTGLVAARKILDLDPSACIIMITGDSTLIVEARRAGVKAFLTKPLALKDLQQTVDRVLGGEEDIPLKPALAGPRPTIEVSISERDQDRRGRGASSSLVRENPA